MCYTFFTSTHIVCYGYFIIDHTLSGELFSENRCSTLLFKVGINGTIANPDATPIPDDIRTAVDWKYHLIQYLYRLCK